MSDGVTVILNSFQDRVPRGSRPWRGMLKRVQHDELVSRRVIIAGESGFTLVEVMVSLLIFGMIAAAGVAILSFSIRAQSATGARLDDIAALNRTGSILSADLAQATQRATRDEAGTLRPAFVGESGSGSTPMLQLVRGGWSNVDAAPRASDQKVAYRVEGGVLQRVAYPMLDGAAPLPPAALVSGVAQATLRYRYKGAWSDRWDGSLGVALPDALELTILRTRGVQTRQIFLVGTGYAPLPKETPGAR